MVAAIQQERRTPARRSGVAHGTRGAGARGRFRHSPSRTTVLAHYADIGSRGFLSSFGIPTLSRWRPQSSTGFFLGNGRYTTAKWNLGCARGSSASLRDVYLLHTPRILAGSRRPAYCLKLTPVGGVTNTWRLESRGFVSALFDDAGKIWK